MVREEELMTIDALFIVCSYISGAVVGGLLGYIAAEIRRRERRN